MTLKSSKQSFKITYPDQKNYLLGLVEDEKVSQRKYRISTKELFDSKCLNSLGQTRTLFLPYTTFALLCVFQALTFLKTTIWHFHLKGTVTFICTWPQWSCTFTLILYANSKKISHKIQTQSMNQNFPDLYFSLWKTVESSDFNPFVVLKTVVKACHTVYAIQLTFTEADTRTLEMRITTCRQRN